MYFALIQCFQYLGLQSLLFVPRAVDSSQHGIERKIAPDPARISVGPALLIGDASLADRIEQLFHGEDKMVFSAHDLGDIDTDFRMKNRRKTWLGKRVGYLNQHTGIAARWIDILALAVFFVVLSPDPRTFLPYRLYRPEVCPRDRISLDMQRGYPACWINGFTQGLTSTNKVLIRVFVFTRFLKQYWP